MTNPLKILVSEDHDLYREGLRMMLKEMNDNIEVLEAADFSSTLNLVQTTSNLTLLLLDIQLPDIKGLEGLKRLRNEAPLLPIVVVSVFEMGTNVRNVMDLGASGFISKSTPRHEFQKGLQAIFRGEVVVLTGGQDEEPLYFSPRHIDTLKLLTEGKSNKEIASLLEITPTTVRQYISEILSKLGVENRVQAALDAKKRGIVID
jgi:DNA-binding NarL/FixJ family response regulator